MKKRPREVASAVLAKEEEATLDRSFEEWRTLFAAFKQALTRFEFCYVTHSSCDAAAVKAVATSDRVLDHPYSTRTYTEVRIEGESLNCAAILAVAPDESRLPLLIQELQQDFSDICYLLFVGCCGPLLGTPASGRVPREGDIFVALSTQELQSGTNEPIPGPNPSSLLIDLVLQLDQLWEQHGDAPWERHIANRRGFPGAVRQSGSGNAVAAPADGQPPSEPTMNCSVAYTGAVGLCAMEDLVGTTASGNVMQVAPPALSKAICSMPDKFLLVNGIMGAGGAHNRASDPYSSLAAAAYCRSIVEQAFSRG